MKKLGIGSAVAGCLLALGACAAEPETEAAFTELKPAPKLDGDPANQAVFAVDVSFWETALAQSEMDCFWDSGVRHVIAGTQQEDITREQLEMAVSRGMTVDAYVYLYWDVDMTAQVKKAFQRVTGFPIGRMWLDIEQDPAGLGANALIAKTQEAVTACKAQGSAECGIYTGPGYWKTYMNDTTAFSAIPLWWAHYDYKTSLSTWAQDKFGGWTNPVAKQWATQPLCGVGGADWNTMKVPQQPLVVVDRTLPPDTGQVPPAPGGLWPPEGAVVPVGYAKVMSQTIPHADQYELGIERWGGSAWITYYTYKNPNAFVKFVPSKPNNLYRFHVRAHNAHGWGPWSDWSTFEYGDYNGPLPSVSPPNPVDAGTPPSADAGTPPSVDAGTPSADAGTPPATDAGTPPATDAGAPASGVPGNLSPDGGVTLSGASVKLTCSAVSGATSYEFAIESQNSTGWVPYFTYAGSTPARTFYPQAHGIAYRWRVRAKVNGAFGAWSAYATFQYQ